MRTASGKLHGSILLACLALFLSNSTSTAAPVQLPDGSKIEQVDFERHVQGLLGRLGCSGGGCHGSFQGKGGLYLSLFGYSPEKDYFSFTRDANGRRISTANPDESLMLLKATGQVAHGGGKRMDKDSWMYHVLREWIASGTPWAPGSGNVRRMEVSPKEQLLPRPGDTGKFKVIVEYADGSREDVTSFCEFRINDDYVAVAVVGSISGEVKSIRAGQSAVVISYRGHVQAAHVLVQVPQPATFKYPQVAEVNYIDREVNARLKKLNIVPSDPAADSEFLRRVTIDTIGQLPTPEEVRAFLADKDLNKRAKKIDELLKHPLHAALWATKFSDITGNNVDQMEQPAPLRPKRAKMWHDWFRQRIADNVPYDEIVKGVLCATSKDGQTSEEWIKQTMTIESQAAQGWDSDYAKRQSLDLFWRRTNFTLDQMGEHTAAAFLGIRLECAQCHKHPFDRWTQDDYRSYANIFAQLRVAPSSEAQALIKSQQSAMQKQAQAAVAQVDRDFAEQKKAIEDKVKQENAEKRKAAVDKIDQENAEKRKALEAELANEPADKRKAALAKFDRENEAARRRALIAVDRDLEATRKAAVGPIEKEIAERKKAVQAKYVVPSVQQLREVLIGTRPPARGQTQPTAFAGLKPKALGGPEIDSPNDPRLALFEWLRRPDNPYLAPSFVNRVWAHYFGMGLVDPVDNFSAANPPSNEMLLDALAKDFIHHKFDIRHLERTILNSRTYQRSAETNETNKHDQNSYSRSFPRRMMAEVVVDVLNSALGSVDNFGPDVQPGAKAVEVAPNRLQQNPTMTNVFRLFGRPPRIATCDCERPAEPALPQTLYLMTDPVVQAKITGGRLKELLASRKTDAEVVEELFLATLSRFPSDREKNRALEHVKGKANREAGFVDVVWALINTPEFILNH